MKKGYLLFAILLVFVFFLNTDVGLARIGDCGGSWCSGTEKTNCVGCSYGCSEVDTCIDSVIEPGICDLTSIMQCDEAQTCVPPCSAYCSNGRACTGGSCDGSTGTCTGDSCGPVCAHGCNGGSCNPDPCDGVSCNSHCSGDNYKYSGSCSGGTCSYSTWVCDDENGWYCDGTTREWRNYKCCWEPGCIGCEDYSTSQSTNCLNEENYCSGGNLVRYIGCSNGACTTTTDICEYGCLAKTGDDVCQTNPPPVLTSVNFNPSTVKQGTSVTATSVASDPESEQVRLICGTTQHANDLCNGSLAANNPSCTFTAPDAVTWPDGPNDVWCYVEDEVGPFSDDLATPITSDNSGPSITPTRIPSETYVTTGTEITFSASASDTLAGLKSMTLYVDDIAEQTCLNSPCSFQTTLAYGQHTFYVEALDNLDNLATSPTDTFYMDDVPVTSDVYYNSANGECKTGQTMILECDVTDANVPLGDTVSTAAWIGTCNEADCFNTRTWETGFVGAAMTGPATGGTFTISFPVPGGYTEGMPIAATCQATDSHGGTSNWGNGYPVCILNNCPVLPELTVDSITPNPVKLGDTVTIVFSANETLSSTEVKVKPNAQGGGSIEYDASFAGQTGDQYTYTFTVAAQHDDGIADVYMTGRDVSPYACPKTVIAPLTIDKTPPVTTPTCNDGTCLASYNGIPVTVTFDCQDLAGCDYTEYSINGGAFEVYNPSTPPEITSLADGQTVDYRSVDILGNTETTKQYVFTNTEKEIRIWITLDNDHVNEGTPINGEWFCLIRDANIPANIYGMCDMWNPVNTFDITIDPQQPTEQCYLCEAWGSSKTNYLTNNEVTSISEPQSVDGVAYTITKKWTVPIDTNIFHSDLCAGFYDGGMDLGGSNCTQYTVDQCGSVTCDTPPAEDYCDGSTLFYYGPGVCVPDTGLCEYPFLNQTCAYGCDSLPGDDECSTNPKPELMGITLTGSYGVYAKFGDTITVTSLGNDTDPGAENVRLICEDGSNTWCGADPFVPRDPTCTFTSPWMHSQDVQISCYMEDESLGRSITRIATASSDNTGPSFLPETDPPERIIPVGSSLLLYVSGAGDYARSGVNRIEMNVNLVPVATCNDIVCSYNSTYSYGRHDYTVTAYDNVGNSRIVSDYFAANDPPVIDERISYTGNCISGGTITLGCSPTDDQSGPLTVKAWAGQCDPFNCADTLSWETAVGITYHDNASMSGKDPQIVDTDTDATINGASSPYVMGDYMFVPCRAANNLKVFDISVASNPVLLANGVSGLEGAGSIYPSEDENYMYVASRNSNSIDVIDISDPLNPSHVTEVTHAEIGGLHSVFVSGNYLYVPMRATDKLVIFNITDPANPVYLSTFTHADIDDPRYIKVIGNYAYMSTHISNRGMVIMDVSDPANPSFVSSANDVTLDNTNQLDVSGNYAYLAVAGGTPSVSVVDVSNPASPTLVGQATHPQFSGLNMIIVSGSRAYATSSANQLFAIIDVSNPASPTVTNTIQDGVLSGVTGSFPEGAYSYAGVLGGRLVTIDISSGSYALDTLLNQPTDTGVAATCIAIDEFDIQNEEQWRAQAYPICVIDGCANPPQVYIDSITPNLTTGGLVTVNFHADVDIGYDMSVNVTPGYDRGFTSEYVAGLVKNGNNYVATFDVLPGHEDGEAQVQIWGRTSLQTNACPAYAAPTFVIDTTGPQTDVICNGEVCQNRVYRAPAAISFRCTDAITSCNWTEYNISLVNDTEPASVLFDRLDPTILNRSGLYNVNYRSMDELGNIAEGTRQIRIYYSEYDEEMVMALRLDKKVVQKGGIINGKIYCFLRDKDNPGVITRPCELNVPSLNIIVDRDTAEEKDYFTETQTTQAEFLTDNAVNTVEDVQIGARDYVVDRWFYIGLDTDKFQSELCVNGSDNSSGLGGGDCGNYTVTESELGMVVTFPDLEEGVVSPTVTGAPNFTKLMPIWFEARPYTDIGGNVEQCEDVYCRVEYSFDHYSFWGPGNPPKLAYWDGFSRSYTPTIEEVSSSGFACDQYQTLYTRVTKQGGEMDGLEEEVQHDFFISCDARMTIEPIETRHALGDRPGQIFVLTIWNPTDTQRDFRLQAASNNPQQYPLAWISLDCNNDFNCWDEERKTAGPAPNDDPDGWVSSGEDDKVFIQVGSLTSRSINVVMPNAAKSGSFPTSFVAEDVTEGRYFSVIGNILIFAEGLEEFQAWQIIILLGLAAVIFIYRKR